MHRRALSATRSLATAAVLATALWGCSSESSKSNPSGDGGTGDGGSEGGTCTGGPVAGSNPDRCTGDSGPIATPTGACVTDTGDAAAPADGGALASDYGDTLNGTEGDDDDCKYHIKYTVAPICENEGITFTVTLTHKTDGSAVTGAHPRIEATTADETHAAPYSAQKPTEKSGGVYDVGPVKFDKAGKWIVRFHFFEECSDEPEDSPHGHGAFFVNVP